jgi:hypothetical protein
MILKVIGGQQNTEHVGFVGQCGDLLASAEQVQCGVFEKGLHGMSNSKKGFGWFD